MLKFLLANQHLKIGVEFIILPSFKYVNLNLSIKLRCIESICINVEVY